MFYSPIINPKPIFLTNSVINKDTPPKITKLSKTTNKALSLAKYENVI